LRKNKNCLRPVPVTVTRRSALGGGGGGSLRSSFVLAGRFWLGLSLSVYVNVKKNTSGWLAMLHCNIGDLGYAIACHASIVMTA